jgi:hypothetical protein
MPNDPSLEVRYAILQGIEIAAEEVIHVFAVDSRKHTVAEFFLRAADWLPSESDARQLGGTRTPILYTIVGPMARVKTFDRRVRQAVRRLSGLVTAGELEQFEQELARYEIKAVGARMADRLLLDLVMRDIFPSPSEMRYPTATMVQHQDSLALGFWTVTTPQEEKQNRPQAARLLGAWLNMPGDG